MGFKQFSSSLAQENNTTHRPSQNDKNPKKKILLEPLTFQKVSLCKCHRGQEIACTSISLNRSFCLLEKKKVQESLGESLNTPVVQWIAKSNFKKIHWVPHLGILRNLVHRCTTSDTLELQSTSGSYTETSQNVAVGVSMRFFPAGGRTGSIPDPS